MTRINLVDPEQLCDQHLMAEHRELTRIPNAVAAGRCKNMTRFMPADYTVRTNVNPSAGRGHVTFFFNKLKFLKQRYGLLHAECIRRGFAVTYKWDDSINRSNFPAHWNDYQPTVRALGLNQQRIAEALPKMPRMNRVSVTHDNLYHLMRSNGWKFKL